LNELLLTDIEELTKLYINKEYHLSDDVREKLLSRGLIKSDLEIKVEENIDDLLRSIKNSLNNDYKSGWESMQREPLVVTVMVSEWGKRFLSFFNRIDKGIL
jgi:hypothetical protein